MFMYHHMIQRPIYQKKGLFESFLLNPFLNFTLKLALVTTHMMMDMMTVELM